MIRTGLLTAIVAGLVLAAPAARAQNSPAENEDGRFTFHRAEDGYLRLDGRSGQVSFCTRRPAAWQCQAVPDERMALEAEIARQQSDNAVLKKELMSHNLALPGWIKLDPPPGKADDARVQRPSESGFGRMMAVVEKVWRRLVDMIATAQRDMLKRS